MFLKKIRANKKQHKKSNFRLRKSRDTHSNNNSSISNHTIILDKQQNICENNTSSQSNTNNFYYKINESINNNHDTSKNNKDSYHNFNDFNEDLIDDDFTEIYDTGEEFNNIDENVNGNSDIYGEFNYIDEDFTENCDTNGKFNGREYDNNKKQNCYSGDAGPYFPNFTIFLLFLWVIKHQIGFEAYKDFANIVKHPKFNANDVPFSLATVKKIENIIEYNSLPFQLKSQQRRNASYDGCLWMTDYTIIINPINIVSKVDIWLTDIASCDEVLQPLINDIQDLEHGYELEISNQTVWVTGGLGVITSDLPEGNEQSGIKNHNAHYGCRNCMIHHNNLHDITFDIVKYACYHHITTSHFEDISNAKTQAEREILSTQYGIREKPSSFDSISRDRHIQCPHDAFHCIGGLAKEMLQSTFGILNSIGENKFLNVWRNFEYPSVWSR
ncbi:uncharacterized protein OCT59_000854 [Rhizophagus irregularis]|nr:hypothetical protein OCT59_000854 [Rhizophagus irregularis]